MPKWIKIPGRGQIRGQGEWHLAKDACDAEELRKIEETHYLPIVDSETKPQD